MSIVQLDRNGKPSGTLQTPEAFARKPKTSLLHQAVLRHLANRRAGTADTKKRDEVSGGGRKPWRQKGTGRARHGSIRSPLWRKGGIVFGPHPRCYAKNMNKKARRAALGMALALKAAEGVLSVIDTAALKATKTKELRALLWPESKSDRVVLVLDPSEKHAAALEQAGRNLARAKVVGYGSLSVHALLACDRVIVSQVALAALEEVCGG